jgi:hypothetical protein
VSCSSNTAEPTPGLSWLILDCTAFASVAALLYLSEIDREEQGAINKRMRGGDQTGPTKAAMAEAKVTN